MITRFHCPSRSCLRFTLLIRFLAGPSGPVKLAKKEPAAKPAPKPAAAKVSCYFSFSRISSRSYMFKKATTTKPAAKKAAAAKKTEKAEKPKTTTKKVAATKKAAAKPKANTAKPRKASAVCCYYDPNVFWRTLTDIEVGSRRC